MSSTPGDRRARRQAAREARRATEPRSPMSRWLLPGLIAAAVVVAGILAIVLPGSSTPTTGGSSSVPPSTSSAAGGGSGVAGGSGAVKPPTISGDTLPPYTRDGTDAAAGLAAPGVSGTDFAGNPVGIAADGRAKAIIFLAHWCPHCQAEVPVIQAWVDAGGVPEGVDLVSVATSIDPTRPNYPPDAWLQREGWTVPVIADTTNAVAQAYGLTLFPFWVFVGPDGKVLARAAGEMSVPDLELMLGRLAGG
jgi:thiol-disulfide isomerase/thioredoxin